MKNQSHKADLKYDYVLKTGNTDTIFGPKIEVWQEFP